MLRRCSISCPRSALFSSDLSIIFPMNLRTILASLAIVLVGGAQAQSPNQVRDEVLLDMQQAFRQGNKAKLAQLLPQAQGHALEPWAVYWELRNRLDTASPAEIQQALARI